MTSAARAMKVPAWLANANKTRASARSGPRLRRVFGREALLRGDALNHNLPGIVEAAVPQLHARLPLLGPLPKKKRAHGEDEGDIRSN
eukprot:CAMPEP_0117617632 /NCGR_PEP_ID=MMETSP0784-20121206/85690_1 /TAXON_ID=39447 /ORGANISM="" /LENGTH=87 /DNA_ID=CAMNT_0005421475 /DNA_START=469 /DNA_END=731 /DNA_ORIENTATION=-